MKELREKFACTLIILLNVSGFGYVVFGKFNPPVLQPVQQVQQSSSLSTQTLAPQQACDNGAKIFENAFRDQWPAQVKRGREHHEEEAKRQLREYANYRLQWENFKRTCRQQVPGWTAPFNQRVVETAVRLDCEGRMSNYLPLLPLSEGQKQHPRELIEECTNQITAGWEIPEKIRQALSR